MLKQVDKKTIIAEFGKNEHDSGSTEVQIALLSKRIELLQAHLAIFKKDFSTQRGLMRLVNNRKQLLIYLQRIDKKSYKEVIGRLGIRK